MTIDRMTRQSPIPTFALVLVGTVVGTILLFAGADVGSVMASAVFDGFPALLNVVCAIAFGFAIARRLAADAPISLQIATGGGIGLGVLSTLVLLLGLAGWLSTATAIALPLVMGIVGAVCIALWNRRATVVSPDVDLPGAGLAKWLWLLPAVALGMAIVAATMPAGSLWGSEPNAYDVVSYHLQVPREWYEAGRIVQLDHNVFSRFPLANEMLFLLAMHQRGGGVDAAIQSHFTNVAISCLAALATFGGIRGLGHSRTVATAGAVILATLPWTIMLSAIAYNEPLLMLAAALCVAWLARAAMTGNWRDAFLAGLMAGLGASAKPTGAPLLMVAGEVALLLSLFARSSMAGGKPVLGSNESVDDLEAERGAGLPPASGANKAGRHLIATALLAFGASAIVFTLAWWIKNAVWFGNPVSPLGAGPFGGVDGWTAEQVRRWGAAHSLPMSKVPGQLWNEVFGSGNFVWLLWPLAFVGIIAGIIDKRARSAAIALSLMVIAALVVWSTSTHMIGRFMVIAVPPAVLLGTFAMRREWIAIAAGATMGLIGLMFTAFFAAGMPAVAALDLPPATGLRGLLDRIVTVQSTLPAGVPVLTAHVPFVDEAQRLALDPPAPPRYALQFAAGKDVYLVGDATAFAYPIESKRLHYRGVFDVPPVDGALRAWLGDALEAAPDDALVVVDFSEIERLAKTYGTPRLELDITADPFSPVPGKRVLTMGEVRALLR